MPSRKYLLTSNQLTRRASDMQVMKPASISPKLKPVPMPAPRYLPPWMQRANGLAGMLAFSLFANKIRLDRVDADDLVLGL